MRHKKQRKGSRGFSLIELIIAIAILVILTGFLAPRFIRYIEKSRESVCRKNMDEMLNIYRVEHIDNDKYEVNDVVKKYQGECPSDGEYADVSVKLKLPWIMCSIHDEEDWGKSAEIIIANKYYNAMQEFAGESLEDIIKDTGLAETNIRNDTLREFLYNKYGGWPPLDTEFLNRNGITNNMYVQPYLNRATRDKNGNIIEVNGKDMKDTSKTDDVILFASGNSTSASGWNTALVYNPDEGTWYKAPGSKSLTVADRTWSDVWTQMKNDGWTALK